MFDKFRSKLKSKQKAKHIYKTMHRKHKVALRALNHALTCFNDYDLKTSNNATEICAQIDNKLFDFDTEKTNYLNKKYGRAFKIDHLPKLTSISTMFSHTFIPKLIEAKTAQKQAYMSLIVTALLIASFATRYNLSEADWSIRAQCKFIKLQELQRRTDPREDAFNRMFEPYYPYSLQKAEWTMQKLFPHARV